MRVLNFWTDLTLQRSQLVVVQYSWRRFTAVLSFVLNANIGPVFLMNYLLHVSLGYLDVELRGG